MGIETKAFGWFLNGPMASDEKSVSTNLSFESENASHVLFTKTDQMTKASNLENELHRFWDLESLGISEDENFVKSFTEVYKNEY